MGRERKREREREGEERRLVRPSVLSFSLQQRSLSAVDLRLRNARKLPCVCILPVVFFFFTEVHFCTKHSWLLVITRPSTRSPFPPSIYTQFSVVSHIARRQICKGVDPIHCIKWPLRKKKKNLFLFLNEDDWTVLSQNWNHWTSISHNHLFYTCFRSIHLKKSERIVIWNWTNQLFSFLTYRCPMLKIIHEKLMPNANWCDDVFFFQLFNVNRDSICYMWWTGIDGELLFSFSLLPVALGSSCMVDKSRYSLFLRPSLSPKFSV